MIFGLDLRFESMLGQVEADTTVLKKVATKWSSIRSRDEKGEDVA